MPNEKFYPFHSQAKTVKLVKSTLFRLLGEILVFVILKLPTTELDLKWKFQFKTLLRFWFKFQLARHGYWRPGSPKASLNWFTADRSHLT